MNKTGIALAAFLLLVTINSTHYFLGVAKASVVEWIVFNACAPSSITYLIGFGLFLLTGNRAGLYVGVLPMLFFGGLGLYLFPWSGYNLIAQIGHIAMTANVAWVLATTFSSGDYRQPTVGLLIGIFISLPFINFQQTYANTHPEAFKRVLGVESSDFQKKMGVANEKH